MSEQRLQKILSQAGIASRRKSEELIVDGRVTINGTTVLKLGTKADFIRDEIHVDGKRIKKQEKHRYVLLNKPRGYISTRNDPQRRPTIMDLISSVKEYVYPVGRLDYDTEGLILLTNDGPLTTGLTHPKHRVQRTYEALVSGIPNKHALEKLRTGIRLEGRNTSPATVKLLRSQNPSNALIRITIREGRNRQVRRMFEAIGHPVQRLKRTHIGPIKDQNLKTGKWRELTDRELQELQKILRQIQD